MCIQRIAEKNTQAMLVTLVAMLLVTPASASSKVRIVRLSDVQGTVQIERAPGDGFDRAFMNLPVIEGTKIKTGKDGRAEIEFEDGSALRLAPGSEIGFASLSLGDEGQKLNTVDLVSGTVYANLHLKSAYDKKTGDQFQLNLAHQSLTVEQSAHFRAELSGSSHATIAVFKGKVAATGPAGQFDVAEKHSASLTFAAGDPAAKDTFKIAKNYETEPTDAWDHQQSEYHDQYATTTTSASLASPYSYGMSDLNYYGNFMQVPGYGNVWQPYFIGAGWSPFMDGAWSFYPGMGYMWVSGYPWGWMPYNYGAWAFASGFGWVWQPGNWNSWNAYPTVINAPARTLIPAAPITGHQTVMVGRGVAFEPANGAPERLTINPGSAGFGVPRGSVNHLDHFAKKMNQNSHPVTVSTIQSERTVGPASSGFGGSSPMGARSTAPATSAHAAPATGGHPH
jgi:FecR protein